MADAADATLRATRTQNDLIGLTLAFAVVATFAALRSANAAHKALTGLERPYVSVEPTTTLAGGDVIHVGYAIFNYGRSPATLRSVFIGGIQASDEWEAFVRSRYTANERDMSIFLADKEKPHRKIKEIEIIPLPADTPDEIRYKSRVFIFGRVRYDSVLGTGLSARSVGSTEVATI